MGLKVPQDGAQGPKVVDAEDEVKAAQVEADVCDGEVLGPDADGDVTGDALATQVIAVGDGDAELRPPRWAEAPGGAWLRPGGSCGWSRYREGPRGAPP